VHLLKEGVILTSGEDNIRDPLQIAAKYNSAVVLHLASGGEIYMNII
jgi:hypothetical protein